jgi:PadR family transcriptional regulator PadR
VLATSTPRAGEIPRDASMTLPPLVGTAIGQNNLPIWRLNASLPVHPLGRVSYASSERLGCSDLFGMIEEMAKAHYLGEFELQVMLTVIRLGEGAYGVPISLEIEQQTGRDVAFGTVYATLERLQKKGLVCSDLGDPTPERGGRAKRYFRVTSTGLRTVRQAKQSLIRLWDGLRELEGVKA